MVATIPALAASPAADRIAKGFTAMSKHDWPVALAWWQDALSRDPRNAPLRRSVELAKWMVDYQKRSPESAPQPAAVRRIPQAAAPMSDHDAREQEFFVQMALDTITGTKPMPGINLSDDWWRITESNVETGAAAKVISPPWRTVAALTPLFLADLGLTGQGLFSIVVGAIGCCVMTARAIWAAAKIGRGPVLTGYAIRAGLYVALAGAAVSGSQFHQATAERHAAWVIRRVSRVPGAQRNAPRQARAARARFSAEHPAGQIHAGIRRIHLFRGGGANAHAELRDAAAIWTTRLSLRGCAMEPVRMMVTQPVRLVSFFVATMMVLGSMMSAGQGPVTAVLRHRRRRARCFA